MTLVGRVFTNRYEIQREIAQGGMAEVYLAHDRLLDRPVALKALFPEFARDPSFVERFRREAQAAGNLNHPNIVAIYDWGQESGTYFLVMEYVEGRALRDLIRAEGPLEAGASADIAAEIAAALASAHRGGLVHRDVKPGNVLLTRSGTVKVTDFGIIARPGADGGLTQTGSVMGTATYFSPEQAQGLAVDGRSDVYSLGVVLYEMVTGVAPFTGDSPVAVAYKHVREEPLPPSRRNPAVPPDLEQIILTAMAKDPDLRYQTADDMRADLLAFRRGRPLAAGPVTAMVAELPGDYERTVATPRVATTDATRMGPVVAPVRGRNRGLITALTVLGLIGVLALIIFLAGAFGEGATQVDVPTVVGLQVDEATRELEDAGFDVREEDVRNEAPVGEVISQDPAGGERADRGSDVTIEVSIGTGLVRVPEVAGLLAPDAEQLLEDANLQPQLVSESSSTVPAFEVIRTDPPEGTEVEARSTVRVFVSNGPPEVRVPNVLNLSRDAAIAQLSDANLVADPRNEPSDTVPAGNVIRTDPAPNALVREGDTIVVFVSSGPATNEVPNVIGLTQSEAEAAISAAGFTPRVVTAPSTAGNAGKVIDQDPDGGTQVAPASTVVLTVGEAPTTTVAPTTSTTAGP
ncbi:MAG TPA: Stk1 family PASTA domain-containing Ser/Thr kinase [Acidimicrobiia bacterium]|nr:Stk1 family PASTA domain-containing Ser/Thr kinase [Acidimicrobiia bacterium]